MNWKEDSKYYIAWEEYVALHPEIDEVNQVAMQPRYEEYQEKMFHLVMSHFF
ncbi:MAG: hypothetical protein ACOWWR_09180 [Eubacteriales bacterium]